MSRTCIKCGHVRRDTDVAPPYACPACGVVYAKAEAAHAQQVVARARASALAQQTAAPATPRPSPPAPAAGTAASSRADALIQQMLVEQTRQRRGPSPYRGMAIAVLVAFCAGFASAAMLWSGAAKLARHAPPAARCER